MVKNPSASAGDIRDEGLILGREDPLEEGVETHFSILAWRIPWTEEPGELQSIGSQRVVHEESDSVAQGSTAHSSDDAEDQGAVEQRENDGGRKDKRRPHFRAWCCLL